MTDDQRFWDILVVRRTGRWFGFRAPWNSLQRVASLLSLVFLMAALSTVGWLMARWQLHKLDRDLALERLKSTALEARLGDLKTPAPGSMDRGAPGADMTLLPSLDEGELSSSLLNVKDFSATFETGRRELAVQFELLRTPGLQGSGRYYWVLLLHGAQGVLILPPALAHQSGEAVLFHRGQAIDDLRNRREVTAHFQVGTFVEMAESEPVYATLLVYDEKGSLILKQRRELSMRRAS